MAIALEGTGAVASADTVNTIEVSAPNGGITDGALICLVGYFDDNQDITCPETGFTKDSEAISSAASDAAVAFFWKIASAESGTYTLNFGGPAGNARAVCFSLTGVDTSAPIDVTSVVDEDQIDSSTFDPPAITTSADNCWILSVVGANQADTGATVPSGFTEIAQGNNSDWFGVAYVSASAAGVYDPGNWTGIGPLEPSATADKSGITIAIRPAVVANTIASVSAGLILLVGGSVSYTVDIASFDSIWTFGEKVTISDDPIVNRVRFYNVNDI